MASVNITTVNIRDNDRFAVVGFSENSTVVSVDESAGPAIMCVDVLVPGPDMQFTSVLNVIVGTRPVTAG